MSEKKIKVLMIADHPYTPSGVGTQTKYVIDALIKSERFSIVSLAGAMKHKSMQPVKTEEYGDDLLIIPVEGYGNPDIIRTVLRKERPDILWFMTDPRYYEWLWAMSDEIRPLVPMVYYHVWDNYPLPQFNKPYYDSTDCIATISKVTDDVVRQVTDDSHAVYIPHAVNSEFFKPMTKEQKAAARKENFKTWENDKTLFFWNNRNARRKLTGTLVWWFKEFLEENGKDSAVLLMHTDPNDSHGQNIEYIMKEAGLTNGEILISKDKMPAEQLAVLYNMADYTINISDAEGFGLATLESLSCGTPIIVNKTGGLTEQVETPEGKMTGIGIEPCAKAIVGSQAVPYIYEDRMSKEDFLAALKKAHLAKIGDTAERKEWIKTGLEHAAKNYNFDTFNKQWLELMLEVHERYGSWETRKEYKAWTCEEV